MSAAVLLLDDLRDRDIVLTLDDGRLRYSAPVGAMSEADRAAVAQHRDEIVAALAGDPEPAAHCPACGSPSWWRSPSSSTWTCSYCSPRDRSRVEAVESVTLASGQWAPGCAPPIPVTVTTDDVLGLHGPLLLAGTVRTLDVLELADDDDLLDMLDAGVLEGFARALVADHHVRPLPPTDLPPLARVAREIGDDVAEYLNRSGRALRARIEREAGAVDRCLLALRADPGGGLLPVLLRALDAATRTRGRGLTGRGP